MTQESLARKLRVLRAERGITLAKAEELTGVTRETLGALEHGQRGAYTSTLQKIAEGYGTTVGALLEEPELSHAGKVEAPEAGPADRRSEEKEPGIWTPTIPSRRGPRLSRNPHRALRCT
jgi:transcriptional regulator with XRE-family HTH domain